MNSMEEIYCKECGKYKKVDDFTKSQLKLKSSTCKECKKAYDKQYNSKNKEKRHERYNEIKDFRKEYDSKRYYANKDYFSEKAKRYRKINKEKLSIKKKKYYSNNRNKILKKKKEYYLLPEIKENKKSYNRKYIEINKDKLKEKRIANKAHSSLKYKEYRIKNKQRINKNHNIYAKNRRKLDPVFRLRSLISNEINLALNGKKNKSCIQFLPYTIEKLKLHLESLFECWMNWNNHGKYTPSLWKDDDSSTWTWQIDHIIPSSMFKYTSMEDEEFKKCWSLENLRPLLAKQNIIDGVSRVRHIR